MRLIVVWWDSLDRMEMVWARIVLCGNAVQKTQIVMEVLMQIIASYRACTYVYIIIKIRNFDAIILGTRVMDFL